MSLHESSNDKITANWLANASSIVLKFGEKQPTAALASNHKNKPVVRGLAMRVVADWTGVILSMEKRALKRDNFSVPNLFMDLLLSICLDKLTKI